MYFYARVLVRHSCAVLIAVTVVSTVCSVLPLAFRSLPTFSDPIVGFETRGTTLAHRFLALENLIDEIRPSRSLAFNPTDIQDQLRMNRTYNRTVIETNHKKNKTKNGRRKHDKNKNLQNKLQIWADKNKGKKTWSDDHEHYGYGVNVTHENDEKKKEKMSIRKQWLTLKKFNGKSNITHEDGPYFCGSPMSDYAHLVVTTVDGSSLLTHENIINMCHLQQLLREVDIENYEKFCHKSSINGQGPCCPMWSVVNYIALLANKTSCFNITQEDVSSAVELLQFCAPHFHNMDLTDTCTEYKHCRAPTKCSQHNAVYNILYFLSDTKLFSLDNITNNHSESSMIFLPLASSSTILNFFFNLEKSNMTFKSLKISALDFGLKNALFDVLIIRDTWLIGLGGIFVFLCVFVYSGSLMLTVMLFIAVMFSLGISYFCYIYIFCLDFFPFMNLLVAVVVIGIGADDAFLYTKVWKLVKNRLLNDEGHISQVKNILSSGETLVVEIVNETLKHTVVTMFVTTITTAVAFFASFISYIPAINCFSVFAGTAVLVNFLLMITWLPATVFLLDAKLCQKRNLKWDKITKPIKRTFKDTQVIFNRFVIYTVLKLNIIIIVILGGIGAGSLVIVFYAPGLQLPDSRQFQLFDNSHLFEQYDLKFKNNFIFERFNRELGIGATMPLQWIWGVKAIDNGNHMNPFSRGHLEFDSSFNISDPESQVWLLNFCAKLKSQAFYLPTIGPLLPNCFIESLKNWMERRCVDEIDKIDRSPCCESSKFPYSKEVFDDCIVKAAETLYKVPQFYSAQGIAGPKFLRGPGYPKVAALVVEFESNVTYSMSYSVMNKFYQAVENWTQTELESAPPGMKSGWFISELQFYDLQGTLAGGTIIALILSSALGFLILLPVTRSFVVSICAVCSMGFSVTVTIAVLVMIGWKLNILESVAISTSAGLAVDFNLHYALSFYNAVGAKSNRVLSALNASVGPTAAAALTTGFAGVFLLCSDILPYSQIGKFFVLIMCISWSYSTWFLCSLLCLFGTDNNIKDTEMRRSASRVCSICSGVPDMESHELEHLGDSNRTTLSHPHSPSSFSATTVVLHEELESLGPKREETS